MPLFMFTDIQGSTRLWEKHGRAMAEILERHDRLVERTVAEYGGRILKHLGDGFFIIFNDGGDPLGCALSLQRRIGATDWKPVGDLRVRTALHAGEAERLGEDYFGPVINRTARLCDAGWGGQILLSPSAADYGPLPEGAELVELGSHQLRDLDRPQEILALDHPELPLRSFPELRTMSARPNNLPPQSTPFVGRVEERRELHRLLDKEDARLLTITGPGGMGKTRLALQVAAERIDRYDDGVYFVPLAPLADVEQLVPAVAEALSYSFSPGSEPREQLLNYLEGKRLLLVLDNFEHLTAGVDLVADLNERAPSINVLATSRTRLNLRGEQLYTIGGLQFPRHWEPAPEDHYSALHLFLESARRLEPDFVITPDNVRQVIRVCSLVGGMPLGIELAASWVRTLEPAEIVEELESGLDFLDTELRDLPERHRSLLGVVDYSWRLLSEGERTVFSSLAVFRGGCDRDAARAVLGVGPRELMKLVDKSLLERGSDKRYRMHEVVRVYAEEKLATEPERREKLRLAHVQYYNDFLQQRRRFLSREEGATLQECRREADNLNAAYGYVLNTGDRELIADYLEAFSAYVNATYRHREHLELSRRGLELLPRRDDRADGLLLAAQSSSLASLGRYKESIDYARRSYEIFDKLDDVRNAYYVIYRLGAAYFRTFQIDKAREYFTKALELARRLDKPMSLASALLAIGDIENASGNLHQGLEYCNEALEINRREGRRTGVVNCLITVADIYNHLGDLRTAYEHHAEAVRIADEITYLHGSALGRSALSEVGNRLHRGRDNVIAARRSLELFQEIGDVYWQNNARCELGIALTDEGQYDEGRRMLESAFSSYREEGVSALIAYVERYLGRLELFNDDPTAALAHFTRSLEHYSLNEYWKPRLQVELYQVWARLAAGDNRRTLAELEGIAADFHRCRSGETDESGGVIGVGLHALRGLSLRLSGADPAAELDEARRLQIAEENGEVDDCGLLLGLELSRILPAEPAARLTARLADDERTPRYFALRAAELRRERGLPVDKLERPEDYNRGYQALLAELTRP